MLQTLRFLLVTLVLLVLGGCDRNIQSFGAQTGTVDLRGVDLTQKIVRLDGQWVLHWRGQRDTLLVEQPGSWVDVEQAGQHLPQEGSAVYQLRILLDSAHSQHLVLSTKEINAESRIFVNDAPLSPVGRGRLYQTIPTDSTVLNLRIHVFNRLDPRPGIPCPVYFGTSRNMEARSDFYLTIQSALFGIFCLFAFQYGQAWVRRMNHKASLLLALNCICWGVYTFFQGVEVSPARVMFPGMTFLFEQKAYLFATVLSFPLTGLLWQELFPTPMLRRWLYLLFGISAACGILLLFDSQIHWVWILWYLVVGNGSLLILLWSVLIAVYRGEPDSIIFLVGLLGLGTMAVFVTINMRGEWMGFGALLLVLADALVLSRRQAQAVVLIEQQRAELKRVSLLKEDLATVVREKFQLSVRETRLAAVLNLVDASILALNDDDSVCFANQEVLELLGYTESQLLGRVWGNLCVQETLDTQSGVRILLLRRADGETISCQARQLDLTLGADALQVIFLKIEGRQLRHPTQSNIFQAIKYARASEDDPVSVTLARDVLQLSLDVWEACTGLLKADFAEASGLWKVYVDTNGWRRTATLDRYLSVEKYPGRPKWNKVLDSAEFVLVTCQHHHWKSEDVSRLHQLRNELLNQVQPTP